MESNLEQRAGEASADGPYPVEQHGLLKEKFKKDWWKYLELVLYSTLIGIMISVHVPWVDEVHSWLIARDSNPVSLLFRYMRYEGTPGLWHLLLMAPAKLKMPLVTLNIIAGIIMAVAAYLVIFRSPFPKIIKVLLPFSYFFLYQYAIVSRQYCLIPLLLFLLATIYKQKNERPYAYFTLIILLACVSLHGTVIALCLLTLNLIDLKKNWAELSAGQKKGNLIGLAVFALVLVLLVIMLLPPADIDSPGRYDLGIINFLKVCKYIAASMLTTYWYLYIPLIAILLLWFYKRRLLLTCAVLIVPLFVFFAVVYVSITHLGIVFFLLVFLLWLSFDDSHRENEREFKLERIPFEKVMTATVAVILLVQIVFAFMSFGEEFQADFCASKAVASHIKKNNLENKKIDILGIQTTILGYFDENIFSNFNNGHKPCFWLYSTENLDIKTAGKKNIEKVVKDKPDYIIAPYSAMKEQGFKIPGYKREAAFRARLIWMGEHFTDNSVILYKRE